MRQTYATEKLRPNDEWSFIDLSLYPICYHVNSHGEASESLVEQVPIQDSACVVAVCPKICGRFKPHRDIRLIRVPPCRHITAPEPYLLPVVLYLARSADLSAFRA